MKLKYFLLPLILISTLSFSNIFSQDEEQINYFQISQDNFKSLIKNGINLTLFLFGALGLILFGWQVIEFEIGRASCRERV